MKTKNSKKQTLRKSSQLLILTFLLAGPAWVQAQNWKVIGNTVVATDFIGTTNAQDLRIRTNGTQKMVVTTGGNVGIGIATPAAKLDVNGTVKIADGTQGAGKVLTSDMNGLASWQTPSGGSSNAWSLIGNAGTVDGSNFIGTTDNVALNFRVNNQASGKIEPALQNTFFGYQTGTLVNSLGNENSAFGHQALYSCIQGDNNTAIGEMALYSDNIGYANTATGDHALYSNTSGALNTACGHAALYFNTTGALNVGLGTQALYANTTGGHNIGIVYYSLAANTNGIFNTAVGSDALSGNVSSQYNAALGYSAGSHYEHGYNNVFLGANTNTDGADYYNVIACGQGTIVLNPNTARFGNSATSSYGGWANWTNVSDGLYNKIVKQTVPGLTFIDKLRPVTYTLDASGLDAFMHRNDKNELSAEAKAVHQKALHEKEKITYTGFIAEEVEASAKELGFDFSGVDAAKNENDVYGLRYAEFVVPLVKAVQELNAELQKRNAELTARIELLERKSGIENAQGQTSLLEQNNPNPFSVTTMIKYTIPASALKAQIKIFAADGSEVKSIPVSEKGRGQTEISAGTLSSGTYTYMLLVDGKVVDTKQMVLTK
jgi:hypothetical protein